MDMDSLFARAAGIVAEIHHSHGIKAALAARHLAQRFPRWTGAFWAAALTRAGWFDAPTVNQPAVTSARDVRPERAPMAIARTVVPHAYAAVRSWAAARGAEDIVRFYIGQASSSPGDLGHRLSILLALDEAWPVYSNGPHRALYLDRLTEFLLACRFDAADGGQAARGAGWQDACAAALAHPGFFGHHLITLAWIGRCRSRLSPGQFRSALGWVVDVAGQTGPGPIDAVAVAPTGAPATMTEAVLQQTLEDLLLHGIPNIHLLTLADAIAWLWSDLGEAARRLLVDIARLHVRQDAP